MATASDLKTWGRNFIREVLNAHDHKKLAEYVHPDVHLHDSVPDHANGIEGLQAQFTELWTAFPDIRATVDLEVAEDPMLVLRLTQAGTHTGDFRNLPASGNSFSYHEVHMIKIANNVCVEHWGVINSAHLLQQIGAIGNEVPRPVHRDLEAVSA